MKKLIYSAAAILLLGQSFAQETPEETSKSDTSRTKVGKVEFVTIKDRLVSINFPAGVPPDTTFTINDTIDASPSEEEAERNEAHWKGIEVGVNMLLNDHQTTSFDNNPYWENDPAKSFYINLNFIERKFDIYKNYVGITTGLGFNFMQFGLQNNYIIQSNKDSVYAIEDTVYSYSKNKLKACYLQIPLLLEFNTNQDSDKSVYLAAGVIGGLRLSSKTKRVGDLNGNTFDSKVKGVYNLSPFKLDATVRVGYADWGIFANYSLIPLFATGKTVEVHPFTVGLTHSL